MVSQFLFIIIWRHKRQSSRNRARFLWYERILSLEGDISFLHRIISLQCNEDSPSVPSVRSKLQLPVTKPKQCTFRKFVSRGTVHRVTPKATKPQKIRCFTMIVQTVVHDLSPVGCFSAADGLIIRHFVGLSMVSFGYYDFSFNRLGWRIVWLIYTSIARRLTYNQRFCIGKNGAAVRCRYSGLRSCNLS